MATAAVEKAQKRRFVVRDKHGKNVFSIDEEGDFAMNGNVVPNATTQQLTADPDVEEFIVRKGDGTVLARLDPTWGIDVDNPTEIRWPTLYLKGCLKPNIASPSPPTGAPSFRVEDSAHNLVAYVCSEDDTTNDIPAGSLVFKGRAFIGANPDPNAPKTELLIYDDFEDGDWDDCPAAYSSTQYTAGCPVWTSVDHVGEWCVNNVSYYLSNLGSYTSGQYAWDKIRIPQYDADIDLNLDFYYDAAGPAYIAVRDTGVRSIYVKIDPGEGCLAIGRWDSLAGGSEFMNLDTFYYGQQPSAPERVLLTNSTWYELHIRCTSQYIRAWYRERDTAIMKWYPGTGQDVSDYLHYTPPAPPTVNPLDLPGDQLYFSIRADHSETTDGRWRFDNITINGLSDGNAPELDCTGCTE